MRRRQGEPLSQSFADAFVEFRAGVESALPDTGDAAQRAALASVFVAAFVGATAISRGVVKADRALADEVLDQVRGVLASLAAAPGAAAAGAAAPEPAPR